ncbi:hypothetical protein Plhal703r1_c10g0054221 [Plasmopara halstedii]
MTSLGSSTQSTLRSKSLEHLHDFKAIRHAGICFVYTDREVCTKSGGELVTICGRRLKDQTYSKYSHWFCVDLQRLPDEIQFTGQGYLVVHHQTRFLNSVTIPSIKKNCDKGKPTRQSKPAPSGLNVDGTTSIPPAFDDQSDTSDRSAMADDSGSDSEPHNGGHSDPDTDRRTTIYVPKIRVDSNQATNLSPARIIKAKPMILSAAANSAVDLRSFFLPERNILQIHQSVLMSG